MFFHRLVPCPYTSPVPVYPGMAGCNPHIIVPALEILDAGLLEELLVPDRTVYPAIVYLETAGISNPEVTITITLNGRDIVIHQAFGNIIEVQVAGTPAPVIRREAE